ncbi:hypothetical protein [Agromyces albus]|uniref:hypothetical protein n=1 Tax=Agromyces albus TaxID=205332 RepID=UPI00277F45E1|nr:hypothetical protein [Agromyces albus]MDQ0575460.1 hypothetical protein [Agromyces albus]
MASLTPNPAQIRGFETDLRVDARRGTDAPSGWWPHHHNPKGGTIMPAPSIIRTGVFIVAGAAFLSLAAAGPASARPDTPPPASIVQSSPAQRCQLTRIGNQFVRCDNLTGAGVAAPSWVPEQR